MHSGSCRVRICMWSTTRRSGRRCWRACWRGTAIYHFLYIDVNGSGLLPVEAENMGKTVITTELGGGGRVPAFVHQLAWSGLTNVLTASWRAERGSRNTRIARSSRRRSSSMGANPANYVNTDEAGFLGEPARARRNRREAGDPVGRLWFPERPERGPRLFTAPLDGILTVVRAMTPTLAGDSIFVLGQPIDASANCV